MKVIILAILIAAVLGASVVQKDNKVHFEVDTNEGSPVGFTMKGFLNPENDDESNVETFFRLAEQLIPLAQSSISDKKGPSNLGFTFKRCFGQLGGIIGLCAYADIELWVGWRVNHTGDQGSYSVIYTPFSYLQGGGNISASSYPAEVSYGGYLSAYNVQLPINLSISQQQICYGAVFNFFPTTAFTAINTNLLQCQRSIPELQDWVCNRVEGVRFQHLSFEFFDGFDLTVLEPDCFTF